MIKYLMLLAAVLLIGSCDGDQKSCVGEWKYENGEASECVEGNTWVLRRITKQWGSQEDDKGLSIAVDSKGNVYVTGDTKGSIDGNPEGGFSCYNYPCLDVFLTKWNADGTKAWTKQWGTSDDDEGYSVILDSSENIYVVGSTNGSLDENTYAGSEDIFLKKVDPNGSEIWTKQWGTDFSEEGYSVTIDSAGSIYVTGITWGALDGNTLAGNADIFLTKWNTDGTKAWTKQWGTKVYDVGNSVTVDAAGSIFITGFTGGDLDGNTGTAGGSIFLTKFNSDGIKEWTKLWGANEDERGEHGLSVAVDSLGNAYVTGETWGSFSGYTLSGYSDIFLTKWSPDGTMVWNKQWGSTSIDYGRSVTIDAEDNIYVTGEVYDPIDGNIGAGNRDVFLTKWAPDGTKIWTKEWGSNSYDVGNAVIIDSQKNIYVAGETAGSFDGNPALGRADIFFNKILPE